MKTLLLSLLIVSNIYAECVVFLSENKKNVSYFASEFKKAKLTTLYIKYLGNNYGLKDDADLVKLVKLSGCKYAIVEPISLSSSNLNEQAKFNGTLKLFKEEIGKFELINWEKKIETKIIELREESAKEEIIKRFSRLSTQAALEYFNASN